MVSQIDNLYKACRNNNLQEVLDILKDTSINIDELDKKHDGITPFIIACENNYTDIVKIFLMISG